MFRSEEEEARAERMVGDDLTRLWEAHDLCKSEDAIFAASGVCDGYCGHGISRSEKKSFLRPEHGMTPSRSTLCVRELQV